MKRLISLVAVFVALFACSAQADTKRIEEKFTIRNGITYHMHRNDVITAEKEYGTEGSMRDDVMTVLDSESSNGWSSYVDTVRYWPSGGVLGKNSGIQDSIMEMMSLAGYVQNLSLAYRLVDQNELNMLMNETQQRINEKNRDI